MPARKESIEDREGQRPTIETIAKEAGVSISTVSRALRHHRLISPDTTKRILAVAERLGYTPNPYVSALMSHLRSARQIPYQATIALLDTFPDSNTWKRYSVQRRFHAGAFDRAKQLGYTMDRFWAYEKGLNKENLTRMLISRGIRGIVIPPLRDFSTRGEELPIKFEDFACVTLGCKVVDPGFHFATNDQYVTGQMAHDQLLQLGYKRIALTIPHYVECIVEQRFSAGFRNALERRAIESSSNAILRYSRENGKREVQEFVRKFKPDAICSTFPEVGPWLREIGIESPRDIGIALLDWDEDFPEWSGVDQGSWRVGAAAVDLLVQLLQRNALGPPPHPFGLTIEGCWVPGKTTRS